MAVKGAACLAVLSLLWGAPASAAADAERAAAALRAESEALGAALAERRGDYVRRTMEIGRAGDATPDKAAAYASSERLTGEFRRASSPFLFKLTVNALRLKAYDETGVLPDTVPGLNEIAAAIDAPLAPGRPDVELPAGDLRRLKRQLERWDVKPAPRPAELLVVAPAPHPARIKRDAGTGRAPIDPVPGLIADLASPEPRARALAADELGRRGPDAVGAYGALHAALSDPDPRVRASAALALGGLGVDDRRLRESLTALLLDKDMDVRLSSKTALARLDGAR